MRRLKILGLASALTGVICLFILPCYNVVSLDRVVLGDPTFALPAAEVKAVAPGNGVWIENGKVIRVRGRELLVNGSKIQGNQAENQITSSFYGYLSRRRHAHGLIWYPVSHSWWLATVGEDTYEYGYWPPPRGILEHP